MTDGVRPDRHSDVSVRSGAAVTSILFFYFTLPASYLFILTSYFFILTSYFFILTSYFFILTSLFLLLHSYFFILTSSFLLLISYFLFLILKNDVRKRRDDLDRSNDQQECDH